MYLFDLEDFKCDSVPNDWYDYSTAVRELINSNIKCVLNAVNSNTGKYTQEVVDELNILIEILKTSYYNLNTKLEEFIAAISSAPLDCFDKTYFTTYISYYEEYKVIYNKINLLLATGGDFIGSDVRTDVDTTVVYPFSASTKSKVEKCVGVYIKQMDLGSEFRGSVNIIKNPIVKPVIGDFLEAFPKDGLITLIE